MELKFCKDCAFYGAGDVCTSPDADKVYDWVTGNPLPTLCSVERGSEFRCGSRGGRFVQADLGIALLSATPVNATQSTLYVATSTATDGVPV